MKIRRFIPELKRRNVFKVASIYAVTAWLLIQIAATTFPMFAFPAWAPRMVVIFSLIGFPIALVLAWAYEVVPEGKEEVRAAAPNDQAKGKLKWQTPVLVITIGILGFLIGSFRGSVVADAELLPDAVRSEKVAVAVFNNFTNDPHLDAFGNMASEWISSGLREINVKTTSPEMMRRYTDRVGILPDNPDGDVSLLELTDAQYVVTGSYYLKGDSLRITSRLASTVTGENIHDFPIIWGAAGEKENLVEDIREKLKGYWALKASQKLSNISPPKYEAYQAFLRCGLFGFDCLTEVVEMDPSFLLARIYLANISAIQEDVAVYQSMSNYIKEHWENCTEFEKNYFQFVEHKRYGNLKAAQEAIENTLKLDPKDLDIVHFTAYGYLELNQPQRAIELLTPFMEEYEVFKDQIRDQTFNAYFLALNRTGRPQEVSQLTQEYPELSWSWELMRAFMLAGDLTQVRNLLEGQNKKAHLVYTHMFNAIFPADSINIVAPLLREQLSQFQDPQPGWDYYIWSNYHLYNWGSKAFALYQLKEWEQAENILLGLRDEDWSKNETGSIPRGVLTNLDWHMNTWREGLLGATYARQDKVALAHDQIATLESFRATFPGTLNRFHRGVISYWQARIHGVLGEKESAVARLAQSMEEGRIIDFSNFQYDWDLASLKGYEAYENLIRPVY